MNLRTVWSRDRHFHITVYLTLHSRSNWWQPVRPKHVAEWTVEKTVVVCHCIYCVLLSVTHWGVWIAWMRACSVRKHRIAVIWRQRFFQNSFLENNELWEPNTLYTTDVIYVKWFCFEVKLATLKFLGTKVPCSLGWPTTGGTCLYCD